MEWSYKYRSWRKSIQKKIRWHVFVEWKSYSVDYIHVIRLSIKRETFISGQTWKRSFIRLYLLFYELFFRWKITLEPLLWPKNQNLDKIVDLKVNRNLNRRCSISMVIKYSSVFECAHDYQIDNLWRQFLPRFLVDSNKFCAYGHLLQEF